MQAITVQILTTEKEYEQRPNKNRFKRLASPRRIGAAATGAAG